MVINGGHKTDSILIYSFILTFLMERNALDLLKVVTSKKLQAAMSRVMDQLQATRPVSAAHTALADALFTRKERVPTETRRRLDLFTAPYWGSFDQA